ncbi:MAG: PQQ-binding-like beta-propeller repeat protein, partial [Gammaproteobacteria bacterium]|nr:PQQ-binding-like beta-propeller repeat protein [Gammaproteobacteria bacterium]
MSLLRIYRAVVLATSFVFLGACSSVTDLMAPADVDPPAELQEITEQVTASTRWQYDTGVGTDEQHLNLVPAYAAERLFVADAAGEVTALDATAGKAIWSVELDVQASGGPGLGEGLVLVGTSDAEVIAMAADTGKEKWRARVSSEVLAAPVAAMGRVIVRTVDGKVIGLDAATGEQKWLYEREIPVLTLRGDSAPVVNDNAVLCGMAGGKLVALDIVTGNLLWEATVSVPTGRSELERLADIDGDPLLSGGVV